MSCPIPDEFAEDLLSHILWVIVAYRQNCRLTICFSSLLFWIGRFYIYIYMSYKPKVSGDIKPHIFAYYYNQQIETKQIAYGALARTEAFSVWSLVYIHIDCLLSLPSCKNLGHINESTLNSVMLDFTTHVFSYHLLRKLWFHEGEEVLLWYDSMFTNETASIHIFFLLFFIHDAWQKSSNNVKPN